MFQAALKSLHGFFSDTIQTLILAFAIFSIAYFFLIRPFQVSGESMYPTFKNKEFILTSLIGLRITPPRRGDVIVFQSPNNHERDFIKRIIGLPGEQVSVKNGKMFINGQVLDEHSYLDPSVQTHQGAFLAEGKVLSVPPGSYFVMGDNRTASSDSREWGYLTRKEVIGRVFLVYWPITKMRWVSNPLVTH